MAQKLKIAERLRLWVDNNFSSQAELAAILGKHRSFLTPYLEGKSILGGDILSKLNELGCDINWLLTGEKIVLGTLLREKRIKYIPLDEVLDSKIITFPEFPIIANIPAGNYEFTQHDWPEYIKIDVDPREHFCLKIDAEYGYSMTPVIEPGDLIFCHRNEKKVKNKDLVAVLYDETKGAIKKYFEHGNSVTLFSLNAAEEPIMKDKRDIKAKYKVILIWKRGASK